MAQLKPFTWIKMRRILDILELAIKRNQPKNTLEEEESYFEDKIDSIKSHAWVTRIQGIRVYSKTQMGTIKETLQKGSTKKRLGTVKIQTQTKSKAMLKALS